MKKTEGPAVKDKPKRKYTKVRSVRFIDRPELASLLGVHIETVKRMEKDGRLPKPLKFGPKIALHDRAVIEGWVRGAKS